MTGKIDYRTRLRYSSYGVAARIVIPRRYTAKDMKKCISVGRLKVREATPKNVQLCRAVVRG